MAQHRAMVSWICHTDLRAMAADAEPLRQAILAGTNTPGGGGIGPSHRAEASMCLAMRVAMPSLPQRDDMHLPSGERRSSQIDEVLVMRKEDDLSFRG